MNQPIEYSSMWSDIFKMSKDELMRLPIDDLDEENLDALQRRFVELGEHDLSFAVWDKMLQSDKSNPAVEYTNIFEKVLFYWMSKQNYSKSLCILNNYADFDRLQRQCQRQYFILRQRIICHILLNCQQDTVNELIAQLKSSDPNILHFYYELSMDLHFANELNQEQYYLQKGYQLAKDSQDSFWIKTFESRLS